MRHPVSAASQTPPFTDSGERWGTVFKASPPHLKTQMKQESCLTIEPRSDGNQDHRYTPVPQEGAEPGSVAVPHLLEGQLVGDRVLDDEDVRLLENFPNAGPVAVQQVLEKVNNKKKQV